MRNRSDEPEDELRQRAGELRELARHLMTVREEEKARVARALHDEMGSSLTAVNMDLMSVRQRLGEDSALGERLARASSTLKSTVEGMRRIIEDLRPSMLESLGLREAVRSWAKDYAEQSRIPLTIDIPDEIARLPPGGAIGLFRIVQEALQNALKYSKAHSVSVDLRGVSDGIALTIGDDGVGFDVDAVWGRGLGLISMQERVEAIGGTLEIRSSPGAGTRLEVRVPASTLHDTEAV